MISQTAKRFIQALNQAEQTHDVGPLVALFADDAEIVSPAHTAPWHGQREANRFWSGYLGSFQKIHSDFVRTQGNEDLAVLEWISEGVLANGEPVRYSGVSILETEGERVKRFATYFDSATFLPGGSKRKE